MAILPVPTSRVTDYLSRTRLVQQTQADQLDLFRLQNQLSTGRRFFQPSEDGRAALRAITLQRNLERKDQLQVNLGSAQDSLVTAEGALHGVGDTLNRIRSEALGVAGTTPSDAQRETIRTSVLEAVHALVDFGNSRHQDNYLFAGGRSLAAPYFYNGNYVEYLGDERNQQRRVDVGRLFDTNIPGVDVFGGLSEPVRGRSDLNPQLTPDTLLTTINGGAGLSAGGSIEIGYFPPLSVIETESAVIDFSGAQTLGDIARLIETGGPESAQLRVSVTGSGLRIETEPGVGAPGSIIVREVASGRTASELGILAETPTTDVAGGDLNPLIGLTTRLDDLAGTKATGRVELNGSNNDLILTAGANGSDFNDLTVVIQDGAPAVGSETAVFTPGAPPVLEVTIVSGESSAADVAAAINAEGTFSATPDYRDAVTAPDAGNGLSTLTTITSVTSGGAGEPLDLASGLVVSNGEDPFTIDTSTAETVEDLLNLLNQPENGLFAEINATRTGIDIRTRRSGADFTVGENGGVLATQLGVRSYTGDTRLEDFNRGIGVVADPQLTSNEFTIEITDAGVTTTYTVDLVGDLEDASDDAKTVQDVINRVAAATGGLVTAELASVGNGLTLRTDAIGVVAAAPAVATVGLGDAATDTLTFTAVTAEAAGNQSFSLEVIDSGSGGLSANVTSGGTPDNVIVVDLGGAPSTTDAIAAAIDAQLADFTVVSDGTDAVTNDDGGVPQTFNTTGGLDNSAALADSITVRGDAAERLGFFSADSEPPEAVSASGSITSEDRHTLEVDSAFNTLIRLSQALSEGDAGAPEVGRSLNRLDDDLDRATSARGEIGSRLRSLETLQFRLEDEEVELRASLSEELDVDLTEAISDFTARQFALQASLQTTANLLQLSLLNFI